MPTSCAECVWCDGGRPCTAGGGALVRPPLRLALPCVCSTSVLAEILFSPCAVRACLGKKKSNISLLPTPGRSQGDGRFDAPPDWEERSQDGTHARSCLLRPGLSAPQTSTLILENRHSDFFGFRAAARARAARPPTPPRASARPRAGRRRRPARPRGARCRRTTPCTACTDRSCA